IAHNRDGVADVVTMPMGDEQRIQLARILQIGWTGWIAVCPAIQQQRLARWTAQLEGSMSQPGDLYALEIHSALLPAVFLCPSAIVSRLFSTIARLIASAVDCLITINDAKKEQGSV